MNYEVFTAQIQLIRQNLTVQTDNDPKQALKELCKANKLYIPQWQGQWSDLSPVI